MNRMIHRILCVALCLCLIAAVAMPALAASYTYQGLYNGQGYVATSTGTDDYFKGHIGSTSTYVMKVQVTYDYVGTDGLHENNVLNSVVKTTETQIERSILGGYYTGTIQFDYYMNYTHVYTEAFAL